MSWKDYHLGEALQGKFWGLCGLRSSARVGCSHLVKLVNSGEEVFLQLLSICQPPRPALAFVRCDPLLPIVGIVILIC